jgi:hypothetical protein
MKQPCRWMAWLVALAVVGGGGPTSPAVASPRQSGFLPSVPEVLAEEPDVPTHHGPSGAWEPPALLTAILREGRVAVSQVLAFAEGALRAPEPRNREVGRRAK